MKWIFMPRHATFWGLFLLIDIAKAGGLVPPSAGIERICCAPNAPDTALLLANSRIWVTTDRGLSYKSLPMPALRRSKESVETATAESTGQLLFESAASDDSLVQTAVSTAVSNEETTSEIPDAAEQRTAPISLAVSDAGRAAIAFPNRLFVQHKHGTAYHAMTLSGIRQIAFDHQGMLWVLTDKALLGLVDPFNTGSVVVRQGSLDAELLVNGPTMNEITIAGPLGLVSYATTSTPLKPLTHISMSHLSAIAAIPPSKEAAGDRSGSWLAVRRSSRLRQIHRDGQSSEHALEKGTISRILAGAGGRRAFFSEQTGWWMVRDGILEKRHAVDIAVDAAGRFWIAGPAGLDIESTGTTSRLDASSSLHLPQRFDHRPIYVGNRPPRCSILRFGPLPEVVLGLRQYRKYHTIDYLSTADGHRTIETALTLRLIWRFETKPQRDCLLRWEQYQRRQQFRRERLNALVLQWERSQAIPLPTRVQTAIDHRIEQQKRAALIAIDTSPY
jgi:hypothetical protein